MSAPETIFGPWYANEQEAHYSVHASDPNAPVMGNRVCRLPLDQQGLARARLIAAAPELLEALEEAREALHSAYCDDDVAADAPERPEAEIDVGKAPLHCEECRTATAAIAKARGEQ